MNASSKPLKIDMNAPAWWHQMGQFVYRPDKKDPLCLTLTTGSAHLKICKRRFKDQWSVRWIIFAEGQGDVRGERIFTDAELVTAFNIERVRDTNHLAYAARYDADFAIKGHFIRKGPYLNLPCPGTAEDGDPNLSIKLTKDIKSLIERFIKTGEVPVV